MAHINILWILPDRVEFDLFLDFAEGPSTRYPEEIDTDKDGEESTAEQRAWLEKKNAELAPLLHVSIDAQPVVVKSPGEVRDPNTGRAMPSIPGLIKVPGVAGQPTYRALIRFVGSYPQRLGAGEHVLHFLDSSFGQYNGLKRIVLEKVPGIEIIPPHPAFLDPEGSAFLYDQYDPSNLPQEREAKIRFRFGDQGRGARGEEEKGTGRAGPTAAAAADLKSEIQNRQSLPYPILDPRNDPAQTSKASRQAQQLIGLLQGRWGFMVFLTVTVLAFSWGAAHALMPGHAKTVVAAYLISQKGNYWHAIVLALVVTVTHTALVVVVGLVIWLYQKSHPALGASLQLWLGIIAGLLVAGMGLMLVWRALTGRIAHHHHHDGHEHAHVHDDRSWLRKLFTHSHPHVHADEDSGFGVQASAEGPENGGLRGADCALSDDRRSTINDPQSKDKEPRTKNPTHDHVHDHGHAHVHDHAHEHAHSHSPDHAHSHSHDHAHAHEHSHHHPHDHELEHHDVPSAIRSTHSAMGSPLTMRMLLLLGITGGIVPCPTATIILLLGIGANVVAGALYAVGVFSLGLALTLMLIGFAALFSRRFAARVLADARHEGELSSTGQRLLLQAIPAISGALVALLGLAIAANYLHYLLKGTSLIGWLG